MFRKRALDVLMKNIDYSLEENKKKLQSLQYTLEEIETKLDNLTDQLHKELMVAKEDRLCNLYFFSFSTAIRQKINTLLNQKIMLQNCIQKALEQLQMNFLEKKRLEIILNRQIEILKKDEDKKTSQETELLIYNKIIHQKLQSKFCSSSWNDVENID